MSNATTTARGPLFRKTLITGALLGTALATGPALAFDSGSTGADGAFTPQVDTVLPLPPDGVFNFTSVNIPAGVTVTFGKNTLNTPVVWLVSGDVNIAGTVDVSGQAATDVGAAGDGNVGDDGLPGTGGPGGYGGGRGGEPAADGERRAGAGLGPGGGAGGYSAGANASQQLGGGTGAFAAVGSNSPVGPQSAHGAPYGSSLLLPLIGGSGGGGGCGGLAFHGSGGGGGGGAVLIAASGTVDIAGNLKAEGGANGLRTGSGVGCIGGPGAGGGVRVVATTIRGEGTVSALGGVYRENSFYRGGAGRIRFEAESYQRVKASTPVHTFGAPSALFVSGGPSVRITSVAGQPVPAEPIGVGDVNLPEDTANPLEIVFETTGIPVGNVVELSVIPAYGVKTTAVSPALAGSTESATASVFVSLPQGPSVLSASVTYAVTGSQSTALMHYTDGEAVAKVRLESPLGGEALAVLITDSGREVPVPASLLRHLPRS